MNEDAEDNPFREIQSLDPEEFRFAVLKGTAAGMYRVPMRGPGTRQFRIIDEEADSETTYRFADSPMNRLMFAILEEYRGNFEKAKAIFLRFMALNNLGADGLLDDWTKPSTDHPEAVSIHPAAIEAAATAPLNSQGDFDVEPFLKRAAAIAAEKYPEGSEG